MDIYVISLVIIGFASLAMAWMPAIAQRTKISYAIAYVLLGMILYSLLPTLPDANPFYNAKLSVHLTELVVLISLMGTGLKIDQPFTLRSWRIPFRLVSVTMVLSIGAVTALAYYLLRFDLASSILLGAVLAPTDPVLASDVQVAPPLEGRHDNVRFSLTAEAGMNDGTAFPFTWLALLATTSSLNSEVLTEWFFRDVVYRMIAGVAMGILFGKLLAYLIFTLPQQKEVVAIRDGFVGIAATLLIYGVTELVLGYGFIAVFVTAVTLRNYELDNKYHRKLHDFTEQIERILVAIMLLLFGGLLVHGILNSLNQAMVWLSLLIVLLVRPLTSLVVLLNEKFRLPEKLAISFFGIRGIGSLFYLSFALEKGTFRHEKALWSIVSFIIVLSLLIHGFTAGTVIQKLEADAQKAEDRQKDEREKKGMKKPKKG